MKTKIFYLIIFITTLSYSQNKHYDAMQDIVKALDNLKDLSNNINRNGWNNSYKYKTYNIGIAAYYVEFDSGRVTFDELTKIN